jgi:hypothetical protein
VSARNDGGPAFPRDHRSLGHNGMTLRDYFAAKAMAAIVASKPITTYGAVAFNAYVMADEMLAAREAKP